MASSEKIHPAARVYMFTGLIAFWSLALTFSWMVLYSYEEHYNENMGPYWSFASMTPLQCFAFALFHALALPLIFPLLALRLGAMWPVPFFALNPLIIGLLASRLVPQHAFKFGSITWSLFAGLFLFCILLVAFKQAWPQ